MVQELTLMQRILKITNELIVQKNGKSAMGKENYFKLEDIQRVLNPLLLIYNVFMHYTAVDIEGSENKGKFRSTLVLHDATNPENKIEYVADMKNAEIRSAAEIQMSGANITYGKRYAVMNAFNISDDSDDPDNPKNLKPIAPPVPTVPSVPVEKSHEERVTGVLNTFKVFKVEKADFEIKFGKPMTEFSDADFSQISGYYSELKKQKKTKEEVFG